MVMHFNVNQACFKQEAGQSGEHRALCPACFWNLPVASRLRHFCASCSSEVCETSAQPALHCTDLPHLQLCPQWVQTSPNVTKQPKTSPKTHSSRLPSYSNTSGSRGRSCKGECPFPVVHLLNVIPPTDCVSAQSDQAASWQIKECPKGRHLAESMPC